MKSRAKPALRALRDVEVQFPCPCRVYFAMCATPSSRVQNFAPVFRPNSLLRPRRINDLCICWDRLFPTLASWHVRQG